MSRPDLDAVLADLEAERAALTERLGGDRVAQVIAAREEVQRLRAFAATQPASAAAPTAPPTTLADLRAMSPAQVAALDPADVDRILHGGK